MKEHGMKFALESTEAWEEFLPLFELHYDEVAHFKDIPLEPDLNMYRVCEDQDSLRIYTVRDEGELVGYSFYFLRSNIHYMSSLQASQDIIFIRKDKRGQGHEFISWCDEQLKKDKVDAVYHHVKVEHNFGPMLERQGYELIDLVYGKRL